MIQKSLCSQGITRMNHTDNDNADDDGTKNNMSPPVRGAIILEINLQI